jgi:KUP system potassium uptake protein
MANEPNEEEQPLLHAATYTQAPKVSHKVLTKEERQTLIKEHEAQQQEAAKLDEAASKGRIGRWWSRLQSGPDKITPAMAIVALGVVYGDIGTSPLYTMQTFLNGQGGLAHTDRAAVLGILSLVFWSITLITTVKYVFIAMRIDNNGEGGIFALYSLIRKYGAWLAIPAMLGGAAFLADSVLTPAVSFRTIGAMLRRYISDLLAILERIINNVANRHCIVDIRLVFDSQKDVSRFAVLLDDC